MEAWKKIIAKDFCLNVTDGTHDSPHRVTEGKYLVTSKHIKDNKIDCVTCGGESGNNARECNYDWILNTREQCKKYNVQFYFKQTGANFVKNNKRYK